MACIKLSHFDWKVSERTKHKYQWLMKVLIDESHQLMKVLIDEKTYKDGWFSFGVVREWRVGIIARTGVNCS